MEILILVLLYYLSQNPNFADSVKPLMEKLKNSEEMLRFLKDLSNFSQAFRPQEPSSPPPPKENTPPPKGEDAKKESTSPTAGIADEFIQGILDSYFKQH